MSAQPLISMVVAATENDVIGRDNGMPWHLPDDLKYFKARTMGKPMLMGRKTFESIGRPLPGRTSIVMTRDSAWRPAGGVPVATAVGAVSAVGSGTAGVVIVRSFDEAISLCAGLPELCAVGGAEIFRLVWPRAQRLFLTRIHATIEGDTFFPKPDLSEWRETERVEHPVDERHAYPMSFITLDRIARI